MLNKNQRVLCKCFYFRWLMCMRVCVTAAAATAETTAAVQETTQSTCSL